ncbi:MAG: hypothetical protein JKX72_06035 [Robiginitomaculum sp.]|nr:hypothetical protein [Robiginitomaculum sp.]
MKARYLKSIFMCGIFIAIGQISAASSLVTYKKPQPRLQHSLTNSVQIQYFPTPNIVKKSRATLLHTNQTSSAMAGLDIAVTTGHGFIDDQGEIFSNCQIKGPSGRIYIIETIVMAPNYKEGTASDWAVFSVKTLRNELVQRYDIVKNVSIDGTEQLAKNNLPVLFSSARGIPHNGQQCILNSKKYAALTHRSHRGLLAHTCKAVAGQSGSPVSVVRAGQPVLIGIHIGHTFVLRVKGVKQAPRFVAYLRIFDASFLNAITILVNEHNLTQP